MFTQHGCKVNFEESARGPRHDEPLHDEPRVTFAAFSFAHFSICKEVFREGEDLGNFLEEKEMEPAHNKTSKTYTPQSYDPTGLNNQNKLVFLYFLKRFFQMF